MKKAAIITLYGNTNYGNKLQNYAVQMTLKKYNIEPLNIRNFPLLNNKKNKTVNLIKFIKRVIINKTVYSNNYLLGLSKEDTQERKNNFLKFDSQLNNSKKIFNFWNYKSFKNYDYYIVGSNQIWNPEYGGLSDFNLVEFTEGNKIALCASFGINELNQNHNIKLKRNLKKFKGISVREQEGKKIINNLNENLKVDVLIDPTMFLSNKEWDNVCLPPSINVPKKYILMYFLGDIDKKLLKEINHYAKRNKYEIINILDKNSPFYSCGPSEFIYLEKNANLICTDSFHSSVFAIIYNKPFIVIDRKGKYNNMNSRINTLLQKFELHTQLYTGKPIEEYIKINYENVNKKLKIEQKKVKEFLDKNLK